MFKKVRKVAEQKAAQNKNYVDTAFDTTSTMEQRNAITAWQYANYATHINNLTR